MKQIVIENPVEHGHGAQTSSPARTGSAAETRGEPPLELAGGTPALLGFAEALRVPPISDHGQPGEIIQFFGKQALRSETSVGANYREASRGRSKAEFISKIGDCLKEIDETEYWLEHLVDNSRVSAAKMTDLLDETRQLIAIFTTIDKRSKEGL